jgi:hypothetical protein
VRSWRKDLLDGGTGATTVAKAYRLLKAVLNTAVDDELIRRNPCRIKGAGSERTAERPTITVEQVYEIADAPGSRHPGPKGTGTQGARTPKRGRIGERRREIESVPDLGLGRLERVTGIEPA